MTSLPEERFVMKEENPNQWIDKGLYFFSWEKTRKKAQAIWFKNTLLLPQRINGAWPHLFSRLRSPLLRRGTMPAQPFSRFFHHTAFAKRFYWDGPLFPPSSLIQKK